MPARGRGPFTILKPLGAAQLGTTLMEIVNLRLPDDPQAASATVLATFDVSIGETIIRRCSLAQYPNGKLTVWGPRGGSVLFGHQDRHNLIFRAQGALKALGAKADLPPVTAANHVGFGEVAHAA